MGQFAGRAAVLASDAPTYIGKARLYPGATFVVGYDTAVRIFAPRYYNNSTEEMWAALREVRELGCRFLVAGNVDEEEDFTVWKIYTCQQNFSLSSQLFPANGFSLPDISSTELRNSMIGQPVVNPAKLWRTWYGRSVATSRLLDDVVSRPQGTL
ncbi:MAG: hypothetical protein R2867_42515 [Caldilineaceae bacterium]